MNDSIQTLRAEARRLARYKVAQAIRYPAQFRAAAVALARTQLRRGHAVDCVAETKRIPVTAVSNEPHILLSRQRGPVYHDLVLQFCRTEGFTIRVTHETDHPHSVLSLVAAGLGISLVPASAMNDERVRVRHRSLRPAGPALELAVAWRRDSHSPALKTFLEIVRKQVRAKWRQ